MYQIGVHAMSMACQEVLKVDLHIVLDACQVVAQRLACFTPLRFLLLRLLLLLWLMLWLDDST